MLLAGGFAIAISAAPLVAAMTTPAGPAAPALAECPDTEVLNPATGACQPVTDVTTPVQSPLNPEGAVLAPGSISGGTGDSVGQLPAVDGIPCTGENTGECIGLQESNAGKAVAPLIETGVTG